MSSRSRRGLCNSDVNIRAWISPLLIRNANSQLKTCHCWSVHLSSRRSEYRSGNSVSSPSHPWEAHYERPQKAASVGPFANARFANIGNRPHKPGEPSHSIVLNSIEKAVRNLRRSCYIIADELVSSRFNRQRVYHLTIAYDPCWRTVEAESFYDVRMIQNDQVRQRTFRNPKFSHVHGFCSIDRDHIVDFFDLLPRHHP